MVGFLDKATGLPYFWTQLKLRFLSRPASATSGQVLTYNGIDWTAGNVTVDIGLSVVNGKLCVTYDDGN